MFHTRGQATTQTPAAASATGRPRSILLVLALLAALGAPLAAAAPVRAQAADRLELTPAKALTDVKKPVRYTAELVDANGRSDVTSRTTLQATGPAPCHQDEDKLSCDDNGSFEVTGFLDDPKITSEPVVLEVVNPGMAPTLGRPPPDSPPNKEVRVQGHTGSCTQDGTLSSRELKVDQQVVGTFTATIRIPSGTFPGTYPLSLDVTCDGKPQGARVLITVSNRPPDAVNDETTATPGRSVRIPVTDNDTDPDGEDGYKSVLEADPPTVGTADPAGQFIVYTPGPGFVDHDQFTYRNCDVVDTAGKTDCGQATVVITREGPVPKADQAGTEQGKAVPILVTENDTSPDPAKLRVRTDPEHGTAVVKEPRDGHIVYTPEEGFADQDTFEYDYCDGVVVGPKVAAPDACPVATVTVTVEPRLPEPEAVDDPDERTERDKQVDIDVMSNDGHPVAARLQVLPDPAPKGTAVAQANGVVRYTPEPGATGRDSFQYDYCKPVLNVRARAACAPATVTVVIRPPVEITKVDPDPTPPNKQVVVEGTTGFCQEGTLTLRIPPDKDDPVAVTANQNGAFTARLKVPEGTFVGPYGLVLSVDCAGQAQETQEQLVVANQAPDAVDDRASTPRDTPVTIPVTANDTDPDGDDGYTTSLAASQPANGRAEVSGDRISYTPNPGFTGEDPFTYRFCDIVDANGKRDCDTATVTVTVEPPPVDPAIDAVALDPSPPNHEVVVTGTTASCDKAAMLTLDSAPEVAPPVAVTGGQDGGFEAKLKVPPGTFVGSYRLQLHVVCNGKPEVVEHKLSVANQPPRAADDPASTTMDTPVTIDVTGNDVDPDGDDGYRTSLDPGRPEHGTAVEQQPSNRIRYRPEAGFAGEDRFRYRFCDVVDADGTRDCGSATVIVTVGEPPSEAADDQASTIRDRPVRIEVTGNDSNPDPAKLHVSRPPTPPATAVEQRQPPGSILYTPATGFTGTDTFRYDYCGGPVDAAAAGRACPFATVTVTVTDTPTISSVTPGSLPAGRSVKVAGSTGSCRRAGTLTLRGTGAAVAISGDRDGGFSASLTIPPGTFPGEYRLELRVDCGGQVQRAEATLTVTNRAPEAADDADTTTRDHSVTIPVTRNDRDPDDPDGHQNLVLVRSPPAHGTAEVQPDQTILYTPAGGFVGQDRFGYSLCDDVLNAVGAADCGVATVSVAVTDTPVISSVTPRSTPPGQPVQVIGNTGSCSRSGTLVLHGPVDLPLSVSADENGRFATGLTVPAGTFPQPYRLELLVDCGGQVQRAEATLTVTNQAPEAVDDPVTTTPGRPVTIDVVVNDRDPDDPDGYGTLVLVSSDPSHGTAEVQPDNRIRYTPAKGFLGQDRFEYSLCDDVLNGTGAADCGSAAVTLTVSGTACVPAGGTPHLEIEPGKGPGGTRLRITAVVDRRLAACPLRFFLGGTPLGPDVRVGGDGSISADLRVPKKVKRGHSSLRLATMSAQTLAEQPFEVVGGPIPWPVRLALGAGALLVGALARIAFRRWQPPRDQPPRRRPAELPDVRAEPHTRPVEVGVEPVPDGTRTFAVRLQTHADPGTQTLQEG